MKYDMTEGDNNYTNTASVTLLWRQTMTYGVLKDGSLSIAQLDQVLLSGYGFRVKLTRFLTEKPRLLCSSGFWIR